MIQVDFCLKGALVFEKRFCKAHTEGVLEMTSVVFLSPLGSMPELCLSHGNVGKMQPTNVSRHVCSVFSLTLCFLSESLCCNVYIYPLPQLGCTHLVPVVVHTPLGALSNAIK